MKKPLFKAEQEKLLPYYWKNGRLGNRTKDGGPTVPTFSQAVDYSLVLIEGIRVNVNEEKQCFGFRLKDHVQRMLEGCRKLGLTCPFTSHELFAGVVTCVRKNLEYLRHRRELKNIYVRPKAFVAEPLLKPFAGTEVEVVIECLPLGNYQPPSGIKVTLGDYVRTHRYSSYTTKGAGKYPEYGRLRDSSSYQDVLQLGLGKGGKLVFTEGTSSNLFFVVNGKVYTPKVEDFILDGITRDAVLQMAKFLGFSVEEQEMPLSTVFECDEVFLTGTASFVTPVTNVGKLQFGVGAITKKLVEFFGKVRNGYVKEFEQWLTPFIF